MTPNDLKKGALVKLRNGWNARIEDNRKGTTRLCTVFGYETEMGSVYAHDMWAVLIDPEVGEAHWEELTLTKSMQKCKDLNEKLFGRAA